MDRAARAGDPVDTAGSPASRTTLVLVAFLLTRAVVLLLVLNPDSYTHGETIAGDRDGLYRSWSSRVLEGGELPYSETDIEYPPGALPFLILPGVFGTEVGTYRLVFALMMLVIDALGLLACLRISKRWQNRNAPWLWVVLVGLMGPLAYARFDLIPAVMTAWALERAVHGRWGAAGGWMSAGGVAKIYPFLLMPLMFVAAPLRKRFTRGALAVLALGLLPFIPVLSDIAHDVGGYHLTRGIHVESLAGSVLFIASRQGLSSQLEYGAGALHFTGNVAEGLRLVCDIAVLAAMAAGIYVVSRLRRGDARSLSAALLGTLSLAMVAAPVLSPQFMLWIIPFGVATVAAERDRALPLLLAGIVVATVLIFPFLYLDLARGEPLPVILLWARNLALLWVGLSSLWRVRNAQASQPVQA